MISSLLPLVVVALAGADDSTFGARMADGAIEAGAAHTFTVEFAPAEGASASDAGMSHPFLQLDVPAGVTLTEEPTNEQFISVPYERLMQARSVEIPFVVDDTLAEGATIGLVLTAYLSGDDGSHFLRRRLELPVTGGASAREGDANDSSWGPDEQLLNIGDTVTGFTLPVADGVEPFDLGTIVGKRPLFLTTYRAHW